MTSRPWHAPSALTHPLFALALVALVLNDHVLKGAGLLPGAITGKLSDVAGLIVAPAVLAWALRVRTERGWLLAHVAVGVGFTALELVPALASALELLLRALGLGARVWPDVTDLLALPALALSVVALGRRPRRAPLATPIGVAALLACTATTGLDSPPPRYPYRPGGRIETDVYLRHTGTADIDVRVLRLRDEVRLDCDTLEHPPVGTLGGGDFGSERTWRLARGDMIPLWDRLHDAPERECYAARVTAHGREWLVLWRHGTPPLHEVELRLEPNAPAEPGALVLGPGEEPPRAPEGVIVRPPQ